MYKISLEGNIPRRDEITINGELWYFNFSYNSYDGLIYVELENENNEMVLESPWPIMYGTPLFFHYLTDGNVWNSNFPKAFIVPNFSSLKDESINIDNYADVELYVQEVNLWLDTQN